MNPIFFKVLFLFPRFSAVIPVIKTTQKLTHLVETLNDEIQMRRTVVKSAASREARMADLKMVIKKLRHQLEEAGVEPVADDPLNE